MTSTLLTGTDLQGWIDEPWARKGESRTVFFQRVITRFCPDFIQPLLDRATQEYITVGFDFWSDPGVTNSIYRTFSTLLAFDWTVVGLIASQDSGFVQRLNRQSRHEFFRAKKFMENFTQLCEYRKLKLGSNSERLNVSKLSGYIPLTHFIQSVMVNQGVWANGVYESVECNDPNVFYTLLGQHFIRRDVAEIVHAFSDLVMVVKYPLDMLRVTAQVIFLSVLINWHLTYLISII